MGSGVSVVAGWVIESGVNVVDRISDPGVSTAGSTADGGGAEDVGTGSGESIMAASVLWTGSKW